jgi:hypothetical protein
MVMQKIPQDSSTKGPAEMFTGDVYFDVIAKGEDPSDPASGQAETEQGEHVTTTSTASPRVSNSDDLHRLPPGE